MIRWCGRRRETAESHSQVPDVTYDFAAAGPYFAASSACVCGGPSAHRTDG